MRFALEDDLGPVVLGEWQDLDRRRRVLQDRLDVDRHLERVDAKEEATVVEDLERIGRCGGHSSPKLFGEVDHQRGGGSSTMLLRILGEGGCSRCEPAEMVAWFQGRTQTLISDPERFVLIKNSR